jgi:uncharacterized protein
MASAILAPGPDGWLLAPEGAAVHPTERTAVVADVHLGYEWARGAGGDCLPAHSLAETLAKLSSLLAGPRVDRLVVAGDLVESPAPCRRTGRAVRHLQGWLTARGVTLVALAGNHDPPRSRVQVDTVEVAGWVVGHGHRLVAGAKTITGHLHPVLRACGVTAPCFLAGPSRIILPAFSPNAAGVSISSGPFAAAGRDRSLRCLATAGECVLDFGPLHELRRALAGVRSRSPAG